MLPAICYIPNKDGTPRGTATMVAPGRLITTIDVGRKETDFEGLNARFNYRGELTDQWHVMRLEPMDLFIVNEDIGYVLMACQVRGHLKGRFGGTLTARAPSFLLNRQLLPLARCAGRAS